MAVVVGVAALALGAAIGFQGTRLLPYVVPVAAFIAGAALGGEAVSLVYRTPFLSTVPSVMVGGLVGLIFAAVSHVLYHWAIIAVAALAGFVIGTVWMTDTGHALMGLPGGLGLAVVFGLLAVIVPEVFVAMATAIPGALVALGGALVIGGSISVGSRGVAATLHSSPAWVLGWVVVAAAGALVQLRTPPTKKEKKPATG
jgi:hypothetical protein